MSCRFVCAIMAPPAEEAGTGKGGEQQLSPEACIAILDRGTSGILALCGDDGWPYAVPLSYAYRDGKLLFHCAVEGHKLDALRRELPLDGGLLSPGGRLPGPGGILHPEGWRTGAVPLRRGGP